MKLILETYLNDNRKPTARLTAQSPEGETVVLAVGQVSNNSTREVLDLEPILDYVTDGDEQEEPEETEGMDGES